jgi:hypothetical protein
MNRMVILLGLLCAVAATLGGCGYGGIAVSGDKVVVLKNKFLVGNDVYVCKVTDAGITSCQQNENP